MTRKEVFLAWTESVTEDAADFAALVQNPIHEIDVDVHLMELDRKFRDFEQKIHDLKINTEECIKREFIPSR